jgi:phage-related protein (TIGR01555 family)
MAKRLDGRTPSGQFPKGKSGNPAGKRKAAETPRQDDWRNHFTGQGMYGRDKRMGTQFVGGPNLSFDQLKDLWLGDDLAARSVETIPKEAMRQGYDLSIASGDDEDPNEAADVSAELMERLEALGADEYIEQVAGYERGYGGGAILLGVNDGQGAMTDPLNLDNVKSLDWLTPLEARELMPMYAYDNPTAPKYGQIEIYQLSSRSVLPAYQPTSNQNASMLIHESRLLVFPGIRVSRYQTSANRGGWGEAVLSRVYRVLRDFNTAWSSAGVLVSDFAQSVIKIAGLWEALALDGSKAFENRLAAMEHGRGVTNATVIDAGDSYERQQTPLSGLPDLLDKFAVRLAAACDMPLTLLFGTSPAGMNATGESDIRFFYDRVAAYQNRKIQPPLKRICQILFRVMGVEEPKKWGIEFRPLWQDSAKDKAATMLTQAQADSAWITAQVLSPEEVAHAHWGKGKYDPALTVDFDARANQQQIAASPVTPADRAALDPNAPPTPPGAPPQGPPPGGPGADPEEPEEDFETGPGHTALRDVDASGRDIPPPPAGEPDPNTAPRVNGRAEDHADGEFNESDHPRASDGKFGEGSGGSSRHTEANPNHGQTIPSRNPANPALTDRRVETIHANHGLADDRGRQVGGKASIYKEGDKYQVRSLATRNGKDFGGGTHASEHKTIEEARAHANKLLDQQHARYAGGQSKVVTGNKAPAAAPAKAEQPAAKPSTEHLAKVDPKALAANPVEAARRANYASGQKIKAADAQRQLQAAELHEHAARMNPEHAATHEAKAAEHRAAVDRALAPGKSARVATAKTEKPAAKTEKPAAAHEEPKVEPAQKKPDDGNKALRAHVAKSQTIEAEAAEAHSNPKAAELHDRAAASHAALGNEGQKLAHEVAAARIRGEAKSTPAKEPAPKKEPAEKKGPKEKGHGKGEGSNVLSNLGKFAEGAAATLGGSEASEVGEIAGTLNPLKK